MKRIIDFGDKNYIDCQTDNGGLFIRIYPSNFEDGTIMLDTTKDMPDSRSPEVRFRINEKIAGIFYLTNHE